MRSRAAAVGAVAVLLGSMSPAVASAVASSGAGVPVERDVPTGAPGVSTSVRAAGRRVSYHDGPVLHASRGHVIFWQPSGSGLSFDAGYAALVERFLRQVAAASHSTSNVYGLTGQYRDGRGPAAYASTYGGAVVDSDPLPGNRCHEPSTGPPGWNVCLTDAQLQSEIDRVVAADHLPRGGSDIYFLVLPNRFGTCLDSSSSSCALGGADNGYCGYHLVTGRGILYAVIPYNAIAGHCQSGNPRPNRSTADPALSTLDHEQSEVVTDPVGNAWSAENGDEIADICLQDYGRPLGGAGGSAWNEVIAGGRYWLQEVWSNANRGCAARAARDRVSVAMPRGVRAGRRVVFAGRASAPHGRIVGYAWTFGGGGVARGRRVSHVWRRPGLYRVMLRVTDSWGNWAYARRFVKVRR
jgi:hypothetical protein